MTLRPTELVFVAAACALAAVVGAGAVHGLYRLAEHLERRGVFPNRDFVMVPGLFGLLVALAPIVDGLRARAPDLFGPAAVSLLLGMRLGQLLPRPPRLRPPRR